MRVLQRLLWEWQVENFGAEDPFWLATGVTEEVGELGHCLLKRHQKIREHATGETKEKIIDAVGDIAIYLLNLMSKLGMDYHYARDAQPIAEPEFYYARLNFETALMLLDIRQGSYWGWNGFHTVWNYLNLFCLAEGIDMEDAVKKTAEKVMQRNWKKNPTGAGF